MSNSSREPTGSLYPVALWAIGYALALCVLRCVILGAFGTVDADFGTLASSFLRFPGHIVGGVALGSFMFLPRFSHWFIFPVVVLSVFANIFAIHHEAILVELPGPEIFSYFSQTPHLWNSIKNQAPPHWAAVELLVTSGLLGVAAHFLARRKFQPAGQPVRAAAGALLLACVVMVILSHVITDLAGPRYRWSVRMPLAWLVVARSTTTDPLGAEAPQVEQVRALQRMSGLAVPFATGKPRAPLCGPEPREPRQEPNNRSIIFVVLESVGLVEMEQNPDGEALLPELNRIAADGFSAQRMYSVGTQTCQSLPAMYSGQHAQPWDVINWRQPLPRFGGLPSVLHGAGYRTAYFHGAGLTFEQKRDFLRMVGMDVLFELDGRVDEPTYGWGWSDEYTFGRFENWIGEHVAENPSEPYFAVLATLTAHHPYKLPGNWQRRFESDGGKLGDYRESIRYTDRQLGKLYDWYLENEAKRGTYFVVISDHAPLYINTLAISEGRPLRFDLPFVVVSPDADEMIGWKGYEDRLVSQIDIAITLGGLVGIHPGPCDQGLDIFAQSWPDDRIVSAVGGRALNELYMFSDAGDSLYLQRERDLVGIDSQGEPTGIDSAHQERFEQYIELLLPITRYLLEADAYTN